MRRATILSILYAGILCAALSGCVRTLPGQHRPLSTAPVTIADVPATPLPPAKPAQASPRIVNPFQELVVALMLDSLDILPKQTSDKYFDAIMKGVDIPVQDETIEQNLLTSQRSEHVAKITALIVQSVYGSHVKMEPLLPQTILYFYKDTITSSDLKLTAKALVSSQMRDMDAYNASLTLLINALSANSQPQQQQPRSGVYVRDINNNLYFHRPLQHLGSQ